MKIMALRDWRAPPFAGCSRRLSLRSAEAAPDRGWAAHAAQRPLRSLTAANGRQRPRAASCHLPSSEPAELEASKTSRDRLCKVVLRPFIVLSSLLQAGRQAGCCTLVDAAGPQRWFVWVLGVSEQVPGAGSRLPHGLWGPQAGQCLPPGWRCCARPPAAGRGHFLLNGEDHEVAGSWGQGFQISSMMFLFPWCFSGGFRGSGCTPNWSQKH